MKDFEFQCSCCGEVHKGVPSLGADAPIYYYGIPEAEIAERVFLTSDTCVLDGKHFYVRGCLEMSVIGYEDYFSFGALISLSEKNFEKFEVLLEVVDREKEEPMVGWLSTWLYPFEGTEKLIARIHFRNDGFRPFIELEPTKHPLAVCQREGISAELIKTMYEYYVHGKETGQ